MDFRVEQKSSRAFKDTFFRALFHEEERALELCNATEGTNFRNGTPIKYFTRGNTSLARRNNDLAFVVANQLLSFQDHQGTLNPNMPFRFLPNVAEALYTWLEDKKDLYKNKLVTIPTPKFYVLYNGKEKLENKILRFSDAFRFSDHNFSLQLTVKVIDINHGNGSDILKKSPSLGGYAYLVYQIRKHTDSGIERDKAISIAVNHCIKKDILADFLKKNYQEVCGMFDWGITIDEEMEIREEEGYLKAALKMLKSGVNLQDVIRILELSDSQIQDVRTRAV
ncbi:MAG: hypothetical protein FWC89_04730 [Defluviitaleaceae bacterium]|nr:hypothetical protein [Defluviitaleaceae bacterium]